MLSLYVLVQTDLAGTVSSSDAKEVAFAAHRANC